MEQYTFDKQLLDIIESSCIPFAVYKMVSEKVEPVAVSEGFCDFMGIDKDTAHSMLSEHLYDCDHPDDVARIGNAALKFATEGGEYNILYRTKARTGYRVVHAIGKHVFMPDGERVAVIWYADEGPYREGNEDLFKQILENSGRDIGDKSGFGYDVMTGLPNMNYFFKLADGKRDRVVASGRDPVLLYFDFNDMKNYNLRYGFSEGDKLILGLSRILVSHFSNINCCRFGGDRFVALTTDDHLENKLYEIFEECKGINDGKSLTVRVGIYKNSMGYVASSIACDRAKMACDENRDSVSSVFNYFNNALLEKSQKRHYILDNLDRAIREGWLTVYYQPIIRSANGKVCDEEALVRWIDPVMGFMSPGEFIPILEEAKLIYKLDLYVINQAVKKMKTISENGLHVVPCSVNISRSDFEMCNIVEEVRRIVDESGIGRDKITIEITEGAVGVDIDYIRKQVEAFDELGFKVWMDDYGSGYSSPEILPQFRFNTIKLDMQFIRQYGKSEKSKVIISELINMALNLGMETVVEGVETEEQVEFLREVGATKIQGFYYCKPIPLEEILNRYRTGGQIGFENPLESDYYSMIGRVNLYDISLTAADDEALEDYFNTMPIAIFEVGSEAVSVIRCNKSYRGFIEDELGIRDPYRSLSFEECSVKYGSGFTEQLRNCAESGSQIIDDKRIGEDSKVHLMFRRIATNPVTGVRAVSVLMLDIMDVENELYVLTFGNLVRTLSTDYMYLYQVDLDTDDYIEFSADPVNEDMNMSRRGKDFFEDFRNSALTLIPEEEASALLNLFTKEKVLADIEEKGSFTYLHRAFVDGKLAYVNIKATYAGKNSRYIILGISNVDEQVRHQEAMERIKNEKIIYSRLSALSGNYIAFYTVDPVTDMFFEFDSSSDFRELGLTKAGYDFFNTAKREASLAIYPEDLDRFLMRFSKENILKAIEENGIFSVSYRLMISGSPRYVNLKAAKLVEEGVEQLILGVNDVDAQVRREQKIASDLEEARSRAELDPLTGVKNRTAYAEAARQLDAAIADKAAEPFAIVVLDINDLRSINDMYGHAHGDRVIVEGCNRICGIFENSQVFSRGEDGFVVICTGSDYENIDALMDKLRRSNTEDHDADSPVIAGGMAKYDSDSCTEDVFRRADAEMYRNKKALKGQL